MGSAAWTRAGPRDRRSDHRSALHHRCRRRERARQRTGLQLRGRHQRRRDAGRAVWRRALRTIRRRDRSPRCRTGCKRLAQRRHRSLRQGELSLRGGRQSGHRPRLPNHRRHRCGGHHRRDDGTRPRARRRASELRRSVPRHPRPQLAAQRRRLGGWHHHAHHGKGIAWTLSLHRRHRERSHQGDGASERCNRGR